MTVYCFSLDCNKDLLGGIRRDNYVYVDIAGAFLHEREKKGSTLTGGLGHYEITLNTVKSLIEHLYSN